MGAKFTPEEDRIILRCRNYNMSYAQIQEKLQARGYYRDKVTIRYRYKRLTERRAPDAV